MGEERNILQFFFYHTWSTGYPLQRSSPSTE